MFELLRNAYVDYKNEEKAKDEFFIVNGYHQSWGAEYAGKNPDKGLQEHLTETRWNQYKAGTITREQAIAYAVARNNKKIDKEITAKMQELDNVAAAPDITFIRVEVNWTRSNTWGYNPHAEVTTDKIYTRTFGTASGCGYDKRSAAVASAFDDHPGIMKILFTLAENALKNGETYRNGIGYGSGYSVIPYFEGGVGVECFWSILKKAGFECRAEGGKTWDIYRLERV